MPRVRDLLYRFRPAGTPGAAGGAGVPVDRGAAAREELEPVFALLSATTVDCADIVAQAERDARKQRAADAERARGLVAQAREQVLPERAAATAAVGRQLAADAAGAVAAAERDALELQIRVDQRAPELVDRVVADVRAFLADDRQWGGAA
jgi:hypothetical protein